jgi:hypothetical protein
MTDPMAPYPATLSDRELVDDYEQTTGEPGDARADADAAEIERRNLDV